METIYVAKIRDLIKKKEQVETVLNVKLEIIGRKVTVTGASLDEFVACNVFDAISFGFTVNQALLLKDEEIIFKKIHIRSHKKRNLADLKSRLIGTKGKTRRTLEAISNCKIVVGESDVGIIGDVESVEHVETAIVSLIKGSKQANMYMYLEKMNAKKKKEEFF